MSSSENRPVLSPMQRRSLLAGLMAFLTAPAFALTLDDLLNATRSAPSERQGSGGGLPPGVTRAEGIGGLKEALTNGAVAAILRVGKLDGYWGDDKIRIPLPGALGTVQKSLALVGASGPLDDLQLRINHAAETAAPKARSIFTDAIQSMTVNDVAGVLRGGDTAGTEYLRGATGDSLSDLFHPPVRSALQSAGAITAFKKAIGQYGANGIVGDAPENSLTDFAVTKGLDGIFYYVGEEERAIRSNPVKQGSSLLRKVFGAL